MCVAALAALAMAYVVVLVTADGADVVSGRLGGDYASFHAAGAIAGDDLGLDAERFYDPDLQAATQRPNLADDAGQLYFAYPVFFVAPYVGLAQLGFTASYVLHTVLMMGALIAALGLIRPCNRIARDFPLETFTVALLFFPMFRGVTGGQNTALTTLLVCGLWRALHDGRDRLAGALAALLLFKPPFALPFLGVLVLARRWGAVAASMGATVVLYGAGAALTDPGWPEVWVDAIRFLDEVDTPFNVQNFVSVPGAAEAIFGVDSTAAFAVGYLLAGLIALAVAACWLRSGDVVPLDVRIAVTTVGAVLISPHALYYDAGLLVIAGLVVLERRPSLSPWVAGLWLAGFGHALADPLGVSPVAAVVVAGGLLVALTVPPFDRRVGRSSPPVHDARST